MNTLHPTSIVHIQQLGYNQNIYYEILTGIFPFSNNLTSGAFPFACPERKFLVYSQKI